MAGDLGADLSRRLGQRPGEVRHGRHDHPGRDRRDRRGPDAQADLGRDHGRRRRPGAAGDRAADQAARRAAAGRGVPVSTVLTRPPAARDPRAPVETASLSLPLRRRTRGYDLPLVWSALALGLIGAVLVWAATRGIQLRAGADPQAYLYRHLFNLTVAGVLMVAASRVNARLLRLLGPAMYVASLLGLLAVFAVGSTINGAHAWIVLGAGFQVQPSEFAKLGLVVGLAVLFTERAARRGEDGAPAGSDVLLALVVIAVPMGMVVLEPDLGSTIVLGAAALGVLVGAGVRARWTVGLIALTAAVSVVAVKAGLLAPYQLARFTSFLHPNHDPLGAAYNINQAHIALANGGWFGTGLFAGPQTNGGYVPEQQTDFVFSVAGEEFGLLGCTVIIALFAVLCWRGLVIARMANRAGRIVAVGIVCWFALQAFQNIGMNLGLTPVTGLPLPFVSYGGSSMFAQGLAIGLLQAVRRLSVASA
ncbi:MAG: rod shape-determining protein RodA [Jatrophihabitans sp.]|nr:MAG: rod shape-determining protein RodA [Jatrophihabitans sp.]